jgi:hypothetical protein
MAKKRLSPYLGGRVDSAGGCADPLTRALDPWFNPSVSETLLRSPPTSSTSWRRSACSPCSLGASDSSFTLLSAPAKRRAPSADPAVFGLALAPSARIVYTSPAESRGCDRPARQRGTDIDSEIDSSARLGSREPDWPTNRRKGPYSLHHRSRLERDSAFGEGSKVFRGGP